MKNGTHPIVESWTCSALKLTDSINGIFTGHHMLSKSEQIPWRQEISATRERVN
jgi:hypothetical protein